MIRDELLPFLDLAALERGLADHRDDTPETELQPLVQELCAAYRIMADERRHQPRVYHPGGEWAVHVGHQADFHRALYAGDAHAVGCWLRDFWRNDLGPIVKQYASYPRLVADLEARERFAELMARDFAIWSHLFDQPASSLAIPRVGHPWGYYIDDVLIAPKALRYHALATQILQITADRPHPVIAEIGAGYGGAAFFLARDGGRLTYLDFDLPETLIIAAYYLRRALPHHRVRLCPRAADLTPAVLRDGGLVLAPNWAIPALPDRSVDLFLNTFSLSEMPSATIAEYLRHIERGCRGYFLHNNMDRPGVVNAGAERTPCSRYPISPGRFKILYRRYDLFQDRHCGRDGDYREVLYERLHDPD